MPRRFLSKRQSLIERGGVRSCGSRGTEVYSFRKGAGRMTQEVKPIRRVVTGHDAQGRSCVLFDGPAPNVNPGAVAASAAMTDLWVFESCPVDVSGDRDCGRLPFRFEPPEAGGHLRIVQSAGKPAGYDPAADASAVPV